MSWATLVRMVLVVCLALGVASLLGNGAHAVPVPSTLNARFGTHIGNDPSRAASATTNSIAAGTSIEGNVFWNLDLGNFQSPDAVSNPAITVGGGYDPSLFFAPGPSPFQTGSFPFVVSQPSLGPQSGLPMAIGSSLRASAVLGCTTTRSVSPAVVPPGGIEQTITVTIRCADPAVHHVNGGMDLYPPCDNLDPLCGGATSLISFVSVIPPANLNQGEQWNDFTDDQDIPEHLGYDLNNLVAGKQYTLALVVQTPNPYPVPISFTPFMGISEYATQPSSCSACGVPASSLTIPVPSLDGPTPGAGAVTFSAGEPHLWNLDIVNQRDLGYVGTSGGGLDYTGPASATAGQQVTVSNAWDPNGSAGLDGTPVTFTLGSQSCTGATINGGTQNAQASCTMALAQPVGSYTLKMFTPGDVSVYPESATAPFSITGPTSAGQCMKGGWQAFGIFKNQGDCVSYVATGGKNPPG